MNAVSFLVDEHNRIRETFKEIMKSSHKEETKLKMFGELCVYLLRHEKMEQTVWYPLLQDNPQLAKIIDHLLKEEKDAEKMMKQFGEISPKEWKDKFMEFKKDVEHHANEEETKLFPKVEQLLNEQQLDEIGREMREFKGDFVRTMKR